MFAEQTFQDTEGVISKNASHFKTKKRPVVSVKYPMLFLMKKLFGNIQKIYQSLLCFLEKYVIIG